VRLDSRRSLSLRLARNTAVVGVLLGLLLSSGEVSFDFIKERERINSTVSEIVGMLREQAAQAAYNVNRSVALTVINGLFEYQPIREAKLVDDFGTTLASRERPRASGRMDWLVRKIFGSDIHYSVPLFFSEGKTAWGHLEISLDPYLIGLNFFQRSAALILGIVCLSVLLASVMALMTYYSITRPLSAVSRSLSSVDTARPAEGHLQVLPGHEQDEMGLLVNAVNRLLDGFDDSLSRYRTLVETMNEGLAVFDMAGRLSYVNERLCRMLGYTREAMVGRLVSDFMDEQDRRVFNEHANSPDTLNEGHCEIQWAHGNGTMVTSILSPRTIFDKNGERISTVAVITDITDRKKMEQALADSERKFRNLFESHSAIMYLVDPESLRILDANAAAEKFYGFSRETLMTKSLADIDILSRDLLRGKISKAREENRDYHQFRHRVANGEIRDVEVYFPLITLGELQIHFGIVHDITERRKVEEALRESEARFKSSFEHAASGMALVATDGRFLQVNHVLCEIMGYSKEELLQKTWMDIIDPADMEISRTGLRQNEEGADGVQLEKRYFHKEGHEIWVLESSSLVRGDGGAPLYFICQFQDVSKRRLAEQEKRELEARLVQSHKMEAVGRLAGGVAHDFNNMLGIILGHTEMVLDQLEPTDPLSADLREIRKAAERSANLTRQLLAFARKQTVAPKVLDLNEAVQGMLNMLRRLIGEDIDLSWLPGADVWPVKVDPSQIDQILANLCVNARDAIADVGKLTIETENVAFDEAYCARHGGFVPGKYVLLAVSDNGSGMDEETQNRLFEPFFTTKELGKGTGLGLATVYGIVKQNNGFINVYSEPCHGTSFKIYIPRHAGQPVEDRKASTAEIPKGRGETVLLVEDEPAILNMTTKMLERQGYTVLAASAPGEALRLAEEHSGEIHLLMTDVVMPEMNGRDLAQNLFSLHPNLKALFMSGYTANVIAHHGVLDEGVDFIQKPFSVKTLAEKVREVLDA